MDKKIILFDTDIGTDIDDALALIFLTAQTRKRLIGVSTVYGPVLIRVQTAKTLLKALNKKIPVIQGHSQTLSKKKIWLSGHEKETVNLDLQPEGKSVEIFLNQIRQKVIIVATGPLTNIAQLQTKGLLEKHCQHLFIMGGVLTQPGLPKFEHNFSADPLAAHTVFQSNLPITLIPLNLTIQFPLPKSRVNKLLNLSTPAGKLVAAWLISWIKTTKTFPSVSPFFNRVFLHDPIAVAIACNFPHQIKQIKLIVSPQTGQIKKSSQGKLINFVTKINRKEVNSIFQIIKNAL
ncbi:nucleoside hydrolase [Patescibacteria group bacterium]|nr:nucleoside hydrolase [Patescibacteria group bacterium]